MIDLRLLRYFVTVAETGSIAKAADILHISQSPLSRQIIQFEARLGLQLFERSGKRLALSRDGQAFLSQAAGLLASASDLERFAYDLTQGTAGQLRIGYVGGAIDAGILNGIIARLPAGTDAPAGQKFDFLEMRSGDQWEALAKRRIDLGLAYSPPPARYDQLSSGCLIDEPLRLVVARGTFSPGEPISPALLDGKPWVAFPQALNPGLRERFLAACHQCGFHPNIQHEVADPSIAFRLVEHGKGFTFRQASAEQTPYPCVDFHVVPWFPMRVTIHAIWRQQDDGALLRTVIQSLRDHDLSGPHARGS